ncbi:MAG: hypothetical protein ABSF53_19805 [Terracidiphilus sp.]|jgi:hypothetical protein
MHNKNDGHNHDDEMQLGSHGPDEVDASAGFEQQDVRVTGIVVFLVALGIFVAVTGVLCYGIGKVINAHMDKEDGPNTKWTTTADIRQLGNLANNPEMQNKVAQLTQQFPSPRLQLDDGYQEIADLHAREDLLLNNYSWVDRSQGKVRIPIEQAMELLAKRGLPVAPAVDQGPMLAEDTKPTVGVPLTNGFARTGYEHDRAIAEAMEGSRTEPPK